MDHTQILNLIIGDQPKLYNFLKWWRPLVEDNLKILKVEYLSNRLLDHSPILNLDQSKVFKYFKWRQPPMEDNLKILKVGHLSNHL